jgi:excisionase family DNA binding protein
VPAAAVAEGIEYGRAHPLLPEVSGRAPAVERSAPEKLLTSRELAARLQIGQKRLERYAREGRLPSRQIGRSVRFSIAEVTAAIAAGALRDPSTINTTINPAVTSG